MAQDYFAVLGLGPGRCSPRQIARHFRAQRDRVVQELGDPATHVDSRRRLDELHLAYATLGSTKRQAEYLHSLRAGVESPAVALRKLIAASLENGLLRYSRRQFILERACELGLNEFQAQLLIAQVQFGEEEIPLPAIPDARPANTRYSQAWTRLTGVGLLATAMFLFLVRWLGV